MGVKPPTTDDLYVYLARVDRVVDGDTVVADIDMGCDMWLRDQHCRLSRINAPEKTGKSKEEGLAAKEHLESLLRGHEYVLVRTEYDRHCKFGRLLVDIFVNGESVNDEMIEDGFAEATI
jgi:endonuclease YncB( thermonuclease family)